MRKIPHAIFCSVSRNLLSELLPPSVSSDAENRHEIYRISSPARDSDIEIEKIALGSTGIEPGPPAWQSSALTIAPR